MRRFQTFILTVIITLLSLNEPVSYAQLASKGVWNSTTISNNLVVNLTGNVTIKGTITIKSGKILTINNDSNQPYTLSVDQAFADDKSIFYNQGTLIIKGNENGRIIIDGGADFTYVQDDLTKMPVSLTAGTDKKLNAGIQNTGNLEMEYVTLQNINDYNTNGGAITTSISNTKSVLLKHCKITKCYSQLGSALMITSGAGPVTIEDSEISQCFSGAGSTERAGGAIRTYGSVSSSLYLTRVSFHHNYAKRTIPYNNTWDRDGSGGAIFWNARGLNTTKCEMNGCLFEYNRSDDNGGAIKTQGSITFTTNTTTIQNNMAPNGAGIYIEGYIGGSIVGNARTITYNLNNFLKVINNTSPSYEVTSGGKTYNYSGKGAGIHFFFGPDMDLEADSEINVWMNGATISENHSNGTESLGGGIYFENTSLSSKNYKFDIKLNHGSVSDNTAVNGGGVYIEGGNFTMNNGSIEGNGKNDEDEIVTVNGGGVYINGGNFTMNNGSINTNRALDGGGVYLNNGNFDLVNGELTSNTASQNGGGAYIVGGELTVSQGEISNNSSNSNGGGIYILNGTVEMGSGEINLNSRVGYGGGVYVYNLTEVETTVDFSGGVLSQNSASYGGGICVDGDINLNIERVQIVTNTAINGGGVCLMNKAAMYFGMGEIRENSAKYNTSEPYDTGYKAAIDQIKGFGGGIYLDSNTSLEFQSVDKLGLFKNLADSGGDEIFANGNNTLVDLPYVGDMAINGYPGASNLRWIEDYPEKDPYYYAGTKLKGDAWDTDRTNLRYRQAISQNATIYNLTEGIAKSGKYICFALGYEVSHITIVREGLQNGESAIFHLRKNDDNDFKIIMTGDGSEKIVKRIAVSAGTWTVTETPWTWAYSSENRTITRDVPDPEPVRNPTSGKLEDRPFIFTLTRKENEQLPLHAEDVKINRMGE